MVIVQINYRRPDMPKAEWDARYTDETAKPFLSTQSLGRRKSERSRLHAGRSPL